jgi:putative transposase
MKKDLNYRTNRHAVYLLQYHLVVVTKYSYKVIDDEIKNRLIEISHNVIEKDWKSKIISINTDSDYIHILFETSPQTQLSKLINNYKTVTSRLIRKEFAEKLKSYYYKPYFWSDTYFISSVSDTSEAMIKKYIENQGK